MSALTDFFSPKCMFLPGITEVTFTKSKSDEVKELVTGWLIEDNWLVSELDASGAVWTLRADRIGPPLVICEQEKRDSLFLRYQFPLDGQDIQKLRRLNKLKQEQFVWDLQSSLLSIAGIEAVVDAPIPTKIMLTTTIHYDAPLTKDLFWRRYVTLNSAQHMIALVFRKTFGLLLEPYAKEEESAN